MFKQHVTAVAGWGGSYLNNFLFFFNLKMIRNKLEWFSSLTGKATNPHIKEACVNVHMKKDLSNDHNSISTWVNKLGYIPPLDTDCSVAVEVRQLPLAKSRPSVPSMLAHTEKDSDWLWGHVCEIKERFFHRMRDENFSNWRPCVDLNFTS